MNKGYMLWIEHNVAALLLKKRNTQLTCLFFEDLFTNKGELVIAQLQQSAPSIFKEAKSNVEELVKSEYRHHNQEEKGDQLQQLDRKICRPVVYGAARKGRGNRQSTRRKVCLSSRNLSRVELKEICYRLLFRLHFEFFTIDYETTIVAKDVVFKLEFDGKFVSVLHKRNAVSRR